MCLILIRKHDYDEDSICKTVKVFDHLPRRQNDKFSYRKPKR